MSLYFAAPLAFNASDVGFPWDDIRKIFYGQRMAKVHNGAEILPKGSTTWVGCTIVTDDKQATEGFAIAKTRT